MYKSALDFDISYVVSVLARFQSTLMDHRKAVKKVMRDLQCTKDFMHTYNSSNDLDIVGYPDSNFTICLLHEIYVKLYIQYF